MNKEEMYIGNKLTLNPSVLAEKVELLDDNPWTLQSLREKRDEFFGHVSFLLSGELEKEEADREVKQWCIEMGSLAIQEDIKLDKLLHMFSLTRKAIWSIFEEEWTEDEWTPSTIIDVNKKTMPLIDSAIYNITKVYLKKHKEEWEETQVKIAELSAPMVPVAEGVAVLTVVGEVDSSRAQSLMESSLKQVASLDLNHLLIDVSGVPVIDTVVASHLFQVIQAMELVGVETTLTGMRAEIARAVVDMGIEFKSVKTKASVQQALSSIGFEKKE
ncbi:STAS domain-containing protein [Halobacillus salinus]|uniref:STAS domain-containing protein n=1 Tax=Halobacillus salinus TaxID=192814 RepID=UPI0009A82DA9|nr:STAS domain-containing protein [Halobacillus salinus]